jgi:hypothetical protein
MILKNKHTLDISGTSTAFLQSATCKNLHTALTTASRQPSPLHSAYTVHVPTTVRATSFHLLIIMYHLI